MSYFISKIIGSDYGEFLAIDIPEAKINRSKTLYMTWI